MLKTILAQVRQYKLASILSMVFAAAEVVMEVILPLLTAAIIDKGISVGDMGKVYLYGGLMILAALLSLSFGILAGKFAAQASTGVACNLRDAMYENIQTYSFSNIDKYSTAGLVTRLTTDVTNGIVYVDVSQCENQSDFRSSYYLSWNCTGSHHQSCNSDV